MINRQLSFTNNGQSSPKSTDNYCSNTSNDLQNLCDIGDRFLFILMSTTSIIRDVNSLQNLIIDGSGNDDYDDDYHYYSEILNQWLNDQHESIAKILIIESPCSVNSRLLMNLLRYCADRSLNFSSNNQSEHAVKITSNQITGNQRSTPSNSIAIPTRAATITATTHSLHPSNATNDNRGSTGSSCGSYCATQLNNRPPNFRLSSTATDLSGRSSSSSSTAVPDTTDDQIRQWLYSDDYAVNPTATAAKPITDSRVNRNSNKFMKSNSCSINDRQAGNKPVTAYSLSPAVGGAAVSTIVSTLSRSFKQQLGLFTNCNNPSTMATRRFSSTSLARKSSVLFNAADDDADENDDIGVFFFTSLEPGAPVEYQTVLNGDLVSPTKDSDGHRGWPDPSPGVSRSQTAPAIIGSGVGDDDYFKRLPSVTLRLSRDQLGPVHSKGNIYTRRQITPL